eukprot:COSAG01_NODE_55514_length_324_cov_1.328889_1_plen_37_part_10
MPPTVSATTAVIEQQQKLLSIDRAVPVRIAEAYDLRH